MNVPFYIAKRYLVSRKTHNIINIISGVSVAGVTVGTMALVIVLSVFNGFENLVVSLFNSFNPDLRITIGEGKSFPFDSATEARILGIPGVVSLVTAIEENALLKYRDKQYVATLKGVSDGFQSQSRLDTMITDGEFALKRDGAEFTVLGYGVAYYLDVRLNDYANPVEVYVPSRTADPGNTLDPLLRQEVIYPSGFFAIQEDFDSKYALVPIEFMRRLLDYKNEITAIEIKTVPGADIQSIRDQLNSTLGPGFVIKDRFQQQEMIYKIMRSEKWAIFMILSFILLIATFNVIGSLSMLILDKRRDIAVLYSMGATARVVRRIFLAEGLMISSVGAVAGMLMGAGICWLQQEFGLIRLGAPDSTFVVSTYPVAMQGLDFILVFITVMLIGYVAAWYPVHNIRKMHPSLVRLD